MMMMMIDDEYMQCRLADKCENSGASASASAIVYNYALHSIMHRCFNWK